MQGIIFKNKAGNLKAIDGVLKCAKTLPCLIFNASDAKRDAMGIAREVLEHSFGRVVVRSSASSEDSELQSNAGAYLSILDVDSCDTAKLCGAILDVAQSMARDEGASSSFEDELFIQPMLCGITLSGVAMSVDKEECAPYFVINFEESGTSDGITSGRSQHSKTFYHFRGSPNPSDKRLSAVLDAMRELEEIFDCKALDVEFAFARDGEDFLEKLYILQVRPLARNIVAGRDVDAITRESSEALEKIRIKLEKLNRAHPSLLGARTIFGVMPDWNPAEIIGIKPKYLALSLYKELVTDSVWASQRSDYGYRDLSAHPLLVNFVGFPYIDTRVSFNSFIPKNLNSKIASKLVNYYLDKLAKSPENHDKVEFEIILSCYHFGLPNRLKLLEAEGFSKEELKRLEFALLELTNEMISPEHGLYKKDLLKIAQLEERFLSIEESGLGDVDKIYWGVEYCKRYGTLPFAGAARAAFVAVQMLDSLVKIGILSECEREAFLNSLNTVSKKLSNAIYELSLGEITRDEFLREFGHLRAGTYSILSPSYKEAFDSYFGDLHASTPPLVYEFVLSHEKEQELEALLLEHGLRINARELFTFIKEAIEGRESVKFAFTRVLSRILEMIESFGRRLELSKDDLAHLDIKVLLSLYSNLESATLKERLQRDIAHHKCEFNASLSLKLPPLILSEDDIFSYMLPLIHPNFIGSKSVRGEVVDEASDGLLGDLSGKIVCVKSADPGYDFLFTKGIAGLITCYGGVNSHMAIRCAEAGLCAVIGAGEEYFEKWRRGRFIELDCAGKRIEVIG
ncbi:MAG: PEP-utilizing enzyme [Wolinella sp.]